MSFPPPPPRRRAPGATTSTSAPAPPPVDPDARAARRSEEGGRSRGRSALTLLAVVAVVAVIGGGLAVALGAGGKEELDTSTTVDLEVGDLVVESVATLKTTEFTPEVRDAVLATIGEYVDEGTVAPFRKRKVAETKLAEIFDQAAVAKLGGKDRALLLDEGLPKAVGKVTVTTPPVTLTALSDADGTIVLVTATVDFAVKAKAQRGVMTVQRTGTLVFIEQSDGSWKITGWTLHVERGGPGVATSPTTAPTTATTVAQ